jgi:hypothetical protein
VALRTRPFGRLAWIERPQDADKPVVPQAASFEKLTPVSEGMKDTPRHLSEVLAQSSLSRLLREADRRRLETEEIRSLLPKDEGAHLVSATTNAAGELVLVMDTPSWAARVRYCTAALPGRPIKIRVLPRGG